MIFGDASFFIACANARDDHHGAAVSIARRIREKPVVTEFVVAEAVTHVGGVRGGKAGRGLYEFFLDNCETVHVGPEMLERGMEVWLRFDGGLSVSDAVSVAVMRDRSISRILSFDSDFDRVEDIQRVFK